MELRTVGCCAPGLQVGRRRWQTALQSASVNAQTSFQPIDPGIERKMLVPKPCLRQPSSVFWTYDSVNPVSRASSCPCKWSCSIGVSSRTWPKLVSSLKEGELRCCVACQDRFDLLRGTPPDAANRAPSEPAWGFSQAWYLAAPSTLSAAFGRGRD